MICVCPSIAPHHRRVSSRKARTVLGLLFHHCVSATSVRASPPGGTCLCCFVSLCFLSSCWFLLGPSCVCDLRLFAASSRVCARVWWPTTATAYAFPSPNAPYACVVACWLFLLDRELLFDGRRRRRQGLADLSNTRQFLCTNAEKGGATPWNTGAQKRLPPVFLTPPLLLLSCRCCIDTSLVCAIQWCTRAAQRILRPAAFFATLPGGCATQYKKSTHGRLR
mmetsp:Transcript_23387/g.72431  ORF Transcript_23387/g.72431 Transcript_23387/m.72431 type:complete len:223 (+) Transcript_23387:650-1318(+)